MTSGVAVMTTEEIDDFFGNVDFSWLKVRPQCVPRVRSQSFTNVDWAFASTSTIYSASVLEGCDGEKPWMGSVEEIVTFFISPNTPSTGPAGNAIKAYEYVKNNGVYPDFAIPFMPPLSYGHLIEPKNCKFKIFITSYGCLTTTNTILEQLKTQPLGATMTVGQIFKEWGRTIKADKVYKIVENDHDHMVTVVGYGASSDEGHYFLIQNSWGEEWGVRGYAKVSFDFLRNFVYPSGVFIRDPNP